MDEIAIGLEKEAVRKSLEFGGNKKERKNPHCRLLLMTHEMTVAGSYLSCQLRESKLQNGWKNSLIEKGSSKKKWDWGT